VEDPTQKANIDTVYDASPSNNTVHELIAVSPSNNEQQFIDPLAAKFHEMLPMI